MLAEASSVTSCPSLTIAAAWALLGTDLLPSLTSGCTCTTEWHWLLVTAGWSVQMLRDSRSSVGLTVQERHLMLQLLGEGVTCL